MTTISWKGFYSKGGWIIAGSLASALLAAVLYIYLGSTSTMDAKFCENKAAIETLRREKADLRDVQNLTEQLREVKIEQKEQTKILLNIQVNMAKQQERSRRTR